MAKVEHWCAGWNLGGYSSDPDTVLHGGSVEDAVEYLRDSLAHAQDIMCLPEDEYEYGEYDKAIGQVVNIDAAELVRDAELGRRDAGYWTVPVGPTWYWIMPCHVEDCDQVNTDE